MASSKRERELARMRAERQAARRAAAAAERVKRRNTLLAGLSALAVAAVIVVIAVATHDGKSKSSLTQNPGATPSATAPTSAAPGTCSYTASGTASKKVEGLPPAKPAKTTQQVVLSTNQGEIDLSLNGEKAPCTVGSFTFLAGQKYFDGTSCHRLTTSGIFVLQCGDPSGSGAGGPGYQFADENLTGATYKAGTVAMANAGPGTNGSQFFLVYKDTQLPPNYTPFGTITKGLDVILKVAKGGSTPVSDGKPNTPVTLTKVTVKS